MQIVMRQISGLGNQLFQYAAGAFYAERYARAYGQQDTRQQPAPFRLAIDAPQNQHSYGHPRPFLLSHFSIPVPMQPMSAFERALYSPRPSVQLAMAAVRAAAGIRLIDESLTQRYHFLPDLVLAEARTAYFFGYWQAHQYAAAVAPRLRQDLAFRHPPTGRNLELAALIQKTLHPVSLHVRRGDYTRAEEGNRTLPLAFYQAAIAHFRAALGHPTFFIFSDDIAWCRQNLPADLPATFVDHNDDQSAHEDIRLMSLCHHHIIANSSFSWWGAWLNPRADRMVFAPRFWLLTPDSNYPDVCPPDWMLWPPLPAS